jgi:DNA-binding transcriptional LysR family regulator
MGVDHPNARLGISVCGIAARDEGEVALLDAPIMANLNSDASRTQPLPTSRLSRTLHVAALKDASLSLALNMGSFVSSFQSMRSMTSIDHANLSRLDLNLLVAFDALLTERSVTRAAARIGLGQSAMSHNLARLRTLFGDELLTRGADGMRPTPRALALADPVRVTLSQIQAAVLQREVFDPATADRTFRIGLADSIEVAVIPSLLARLGETAPAVSLRLRPIDRRTILEDLDTGRLDLGIGVFDQGQIHHKRRALYSENFLCLFNPARVNFIPPLSLEDYLSVPHVLTSLTDDTHGAVDQALAKLKLKRSIALTTPGFLAVPFVLRRAPVITTMPSRLARYFADAFGLATSPAPIELPTFTISLLWHASFDHDPGHVWLRQTVVGLASEVAVEL